MPSTEWFEEQMQVETQLLSQPMSHEAWHALAALHQRFANEVNSVAAFLAQADIAGDDESAGESGTRSVHTIRGIRYEVSHNHVQRKCLSASNKVASIIGDARIQALLACASADAACEVEPAGAPGAASSSTDEDEVASATEELRRGSLLDAARESPAEQPEMGALRVVAPLHYLWTLHGVTVYARAAIRDEADGAIQLGGFAAGEGDDDQPVSCLLRVLAAAGLSAEIARLGAVVYEGSVAVPVDLAGVLPLEWPRLHRVPLSLAGRFVRPEALRRAPKRVHNESSLAGLIQHMQLRMVPDAAALCDERGIAAFSGDDARNALQLEAVCAGICQDLHRMGLSIRHMGRVRAACSSASARALLFVEMAARAAKAEVRRLIHEERAEPEEALSKIVACAVPGANGGRGAALWRCTIRPLIEAKFSGALSVRERGKTVSATDRLGDGSAGSRSSASGDEALGAAAGEPALPLVCWRTLMLRILRLCGARARESLRSEYVRGFAGAVDGTGAFWEVDSGDIPSFAPRCAPSGVVSAARALVSLLGPAAAAAASRLERAYIAERALVHCVECLRLGCGGAAAFPLLRQCAEALWAAGAASTAGDLVAEALMAAEPYIDRSADARAFTAYALLVLGSSLSHAEDSTSMLDEAATHFSRLAPPSARSYRAWATALVQQALRRSDPQDKVQLLRVALEKLWWADAASAAPMHMAGFDASTSSEARRAQWVCDLVLRPQALSVMRQLRGHSSEITGLLISKRGDLVSASDDATVRVWPLSSASTVSAAREVLITHTSGFTAMDVDDNTIVTASERDASLHVWALDSGASRANVVVGADAVTSIAVRGSVLYSGHRSGSVIAWDLTAGRTIGAYRGHSAEVTAVRAAVARIVSASQDGTVRIWRPPPDASDADAFTGDPTATAGPRAVPAGSSAARLRRLEGMFVLDVGGEGIVALDCEDTGAVVVVVTRSDALAVIDLRRAAAGSGGHARGESAATVTSDHATPDLRQHGSAVREIDAPPGIACVRIRGSMIVTGHEDGLVHVFDAPSGALVRSVEVSFGPVTALDVHGSLIAVATLDDEAKSPLIHMLTSDAAAEGRDGSGAVGLDRESVSVPHAAPKKGFLVKEGHKIKSWKTRFFVLNAGMMSYYKRKTDAVPAGEISLGDGTIVRESDRRPFCFEISTPGKNFYLCANDAIERDAWIKAVRAHLAAFAISMEERSSVRTPDSARYRNDSVATQDSTSTPSPRLPRRGSRLGSWARRDSFTVPQDAGATREVEDRLRALDEERGWSDDA